MRQTISLQFFTKSEVARMLRVDRKTTLAEMIADGRIATVPMGRRVRISAEEIDRIMKEGIPPAGAPRPRGGGRRRRAAPPPPPDITKIPI